MAADWSARTLTALRAARWAQAVTALPPLPAAAPQAAPRDDDALARQADSLSIEAHALAERLLIGDGCAVLTDWDALKAALSLRDLRWVSIGTRQAQVLARLDAALAAPLAEAMTRPAHAAVRQRVFSAHATLSGLLYIAGFLEDAMPCALFMREVLHAQDEGARCLARRFLCAAYECHAASGGLLLAHPGLHDPARYALAAGTPAAPAPDMAVDAQQLLGAMQELLPQEEAASEALCVLLHGALRAGHDADACVHELRLLCKQGAPEEALRGVLAPTLATEPPALAHALRVLRASTPRWDGTCRAAQDAVQ